MISIRPSAVALFLLSFAQTSFAADSAPTIHFSDLTSGPNTGGENNAGVIVTLYGSRFGASRGTPC